MERVIFLLPIGNIDKKILLRLKEKIKISLEGYNIEINIYLEEIQLDNFDYDIERKQYHASRILKKILKIVREKRFFRTLGVIDRDIYTKNYTYNFGIAKVPSKISLISVTRLRDEFYKELGLLYKKSTNKDQFDLRVFKEANHELGHTFGLKHCNSFCVMQFSNCLADIDNKPVNFCLSCFSKLNFDEESLILDDLL